MTHGSLFSGIGGWSLAADWMRWPNLFHCEIDGFCNKVLAKHWPQVPRHKDVCAFDGKAWQGKIDVLSGSFPCQPFSSLGDRKGTKDKRHLWPEMLRVVRESRPAWVVAENVAGYLSLAHDEVAGGLEDEGYEVWAFSLQAASVNAPHRRERIWVLAHATGGRRQHALQKLQPGIRDGQLAGQRTMPVWDGPMPPRTSFCGMADGLSSPPHEPYERAHRIRALGNAIVPEIAYHLFRTIKQHHFSEAA